MAAMEDDPAFAVLPPKLKRRIDEAFDAAVSSRKRHRPTLGQSTPVQPGGFLVDDVSPGGFISDERSPELPHSSFAGGFLRDGSPASLVDEEISSPTAIPLSSIPTALQILDLQPDDEDVLAVFQNAATGWGDSNRVSPQDEDTSPQDALVSRRDWRAVCAALLDTGPSQTDMLPSDDHAPIGGVDASVEDLSDLTPDSAEEYVDSTGTESGPDDSDGDYRGGGIVPRKPSRRGTRAATTRAKAKTAKGREPHSHRSSSQSVSSEESGDEHEHTRLTARQKKECRIAFALFFPDVADEDLDRQRIRVSDLTRVSQLLKEKISTEEVRIRYLKPHGSSWPLCICYRLSKCLRHLRQSLTSPWDWLISNA